MARVIGYLPDDTEARARQAAKARGTTVGGWIAEQVAEKVEKSWPPEVLAAIGRFPDLPDLKAIRTGCVAIPRGCALGYPLIAGTAVNRGLALTTSDTREFAGEPAAGGLDGGVVRAFNKEKPLQVRDEGSI